MADIVIGSEVPKGEEIKNLLQLGRLPYNSNYTGTFCGLSLSGVPDDGKCL